jgi:hypothetical protein
VQELQWRAGPALADDLVREPDRQVLRLGHRPPDLLLGMLQRTGERERPLVSLAGQHAEIRVIHVRSSFGHVVEVGFQRVEPVGPGGPVRGQPVIDFP